MSQTDYRVTAVDIAATHHVDRHPVRIAGLVIDRSVERGIHLAGVVIAEPGSPLRISDPAYWKVEEEPR